MSVQFAQLYHYIERVRKQYQKFERDVDKETKRIEKVYNENCTRTKKISEILRVIGHEHRYGAASNLVQVQQQ